MNLYVTLKEETRSVTIMIYFSLLEYNYVVKNKYKEKKNGTG